MKLIINHRYHDHLSIIDQFHPIKIVIFTDNSSDNGLMKLPGPAEDFDRLGQVISMGYMLQLHDYFNFEMMKSCFFMRFEGKCQLRWRSVPVSAVQRSWYRNYVTMEWQLCSIQSQLDMFFNLFLNDDSDALWVWFEVPEIAKKSLLQAEVTLHKVGYRIFISWRQQVGSVNDRWKQLICSFKTY